MLRKCSNNLQSFAKHFSLFPPSHTVTKRQAKKTSLTEIPAEEIKTEDELGPSFFSRTIGL